MIIADIDNYPLIMNIPISLMRRILRKYIDFPNTEQESNVHSFFRKLLTKATDEGNRTEVVTSKSKK